MNATPFVANTLWWLSCAPGAIRYRRAIRNAEEAQRSVLARILADSSGTIYGREHGFANIRSVEDYQARVPLTDYEDYHPYIHRIAQVESDVLTRGVPICFEPSSGSSSASKLIPYTHQLRAEFQAAIAPWIFDMFSRDRRLLKGRAYWSISPAVMQIEAGGGVIPVGFEDDTAYLNPVARKLIRSSLAVPTEVERITDVETFRYVTLAYLLKARDLTLISVWNPTFLSLILSGLKDWAQVLINDIANGTLSPPGGLASEITSALKPSFSPDQKRAKQIESALSHGSSRYDLLWPNLRLISCWDSAYASVSAAKLREQFPNVGIAPKGLLATEGVVSIPYGPRRDHPLALLSHFLEFSPEDNPEVCLPAWALEKGCCYSVILTTGGGFYRYRLRDIVRVTGFLHDCPLVDFVGRENVVSDHYGEKLNELHVSTVLDSIGINYAFALLAPDGDGVVDHYTLFLADNTCPDSRELERICKGLESGLQQNTHYAYCRRLGQLLHSDVCWINTGPECAWFGYYNKCRDRGQKEGDIKSRVLDSNIGWRETLICSE